MTVPARHSHHPRGQRLLALLLAVLLSVASLSGHAAMDACSVDCATPLAEMVDGVDADCGACAAMAAMPLIAASAADTLAGTADPALVDFIPLPARPPPRP
ncbi:hypothetical protein [Halomonas saccharevitans]|uniref:Uncharacterized protein n=1 Tax=Halomonas saccharevitans TaxID=416872 RepID=A0A1I7BVH3_9GAMM|nr:hypothetical protein [Halomonas saccharevitans]SFT91182.1 hypothetical protein SAMN04487956_1313 [Halomonas saccharevitans]